MRSASRLSTVLGPMMVAGIGFGLMYSTAYNTGTYGAASATVNTGAATRRLDRHRTAEHDRDDRGHQLPDRAPAGAADAGAPGADPWLHDRVLVGRGNLGRRHGCLRPADAPWPAACARQGDLDAGRGSAGATE